MPQLNHSSHFKTYRLAYMGVLAALSLILVALIHFPIFPAAPYLEYDMADVPIVLCSFLFGPWAGLALTAVVSVLQWLLISPQSQVWGAIMHFCATGVLVLFTGCMYRKHKTKKRAGLSLILGAVGMVLIMIPLNLLITPIYSGMPVDSVAGLLVPILIPFNAIKAGINAVLSFFLYKPLSRTIKKIDQKLFKQPT